MDTTYTARFQLPDLIERGRANLLKCETFRDGAVAAPSSGTVSVFNADGAAVVDGAAVTVVSSVAQYSVAAATLDGKTLAIGWRVEWALTMPDGVVHSFRNSAALVRARLYPVISDVDIYRRHPDFNPTDSGSVAASGINYQDYIDESWVEIQSKLIERGNRPNLVMSPSSFRLAHLYGSLELICRHFSSTAGDGSRWNALAATYGEKYAGAWRDLNFLYDSDDDGITDDPTRRRAASSSIWLGSGPR
jgi:hypothetical protein